MGFKPATKDKRCKSLFKVHGGILLFGKFESNPILQKCIYIMLKTMD